MIDKILPLVSVIVPCYNHEKYVKETIESILNQTYKNIELIVIDDGSKDNSVKIIQELADNHQFTFIHRKNKGLNSTLNELINLSKGELIAPLASDDYWDSLKIEEQVKVMLENKNVELCFTEHFDINMESNVVGEGKYRILKKEKQSFKETIYNPDFPPASLMYRKVTIEKVNFRYIDNIDIIDDLYSWLYILSYGGYAYVIPIKLVYYRTHATNTHSDHLKIAKGHIKTLELFKDKISNWEDVEIEWSLRNANLLARTDKKESFKYLLKGIHKILDIRIYKVVIKLLFIAK
jgi:alpha-1,3-rhamnosyltransferase